MSWLAVFGLSLLLHLFPASGGLSIFDNDQNNPTKPAEVSNADGGAIVDPWGR